MEKLRFIGILAYPKTVLKNSCLSTVGEKNIRPPTKKQQNKYIFQYCNSNVTIFGSLLLLLIIILQKLSKEIKSNNNCHCKI